METQTKKTILTIEDEEITYTVLIKVLEDAGFSVVHMMNGDEALSWVHHHRPDLILLDLVVPGITGLDLLSQIRRNDGTKETPILVLSQLNDSDSISRAIGLGAQGYLVKADYQLEDIVRKIKEVLKLS